MKSKIYKICGVALALVLVFSLAGAFLPLRQVEAQAYTPNQWNAMGVPSGSAYILNGGDVTDFAVASDGRTVYAVDATLRDFVQGKWRVKPAVYKSSWLPYFSQLAQAPGDTVAPYLVAVSPDDPTCVAVVVDSTPLDTPLDGTADTVFYSNNGGSTWADLGNPWTDEDVTDIAVSPARSQALLGRDIVVSTSDTGTWAATADSITFTDSGGADVVVMTFTAGSPADVVVTPGTGVTVVTTATTLTITFAGGSSTCTLQAVRNNLAGTWASTGATTVLPTTDLDTDITLTGSGAPPGTFIVPDAGEFGDIYCNDGSGWLSASLGADQIASADDLFGPNKGKVFDFTSLALAPAWVGDRCVVAVGSDAAATYLILIDVARLYSVPIQSPVIIAGPVNMDTAATNSPADVGASSDAIASSSVVLPSDFDSMIRSGRRSWVGWTSAALSDDVYRVDDISVRKLEIMSTPISIYSLAYSGTISSGTLFAGETDDTMVWYTENPESAIPSWTRSEKAPTGDTPWKTVVAVHPDFAANKTVYAGTSGVESAFSRSKNGGVSFNQIALIETEVDVIQDVMPTPDGSKIFMATASNGVANAWPAWSDSKLESLWVSKTPPGSTSWERVRVSWIGGAEADWGDEIGDSIIRLNPEWDSAPTIYWCDGPGPYVATAYAGRFTGTPGVNIQRSADGGDIFVARVADIYIADLTVESKDVVYFGDATSTNVYKSTNGGRYWEVPISSTLAGGPVYDLEMAPSYPEKPVEGNLLVGGVGSGTVFSTNGGASFRLLSSYVSGGTLMQVLADVDYAENNTVYATSNTAGAGIWRYEINKSNAWEQILVPGAPASDFPVTGQMTGLAMHCGVLFGSWVDAAITPTVGAVADAFTITGTGTGGTNIDRGKITVTAGSVVATPSGVGTVGGINAAVTITPAMGAVDFTIPAPAPAGTIVVTATAANTSGTWENTFMQTWGYPTAAITSTDPDGDAAVWIGNARASGLFVLPDVTPAPGVVGPAASGVDRSLIPDVPTIANWQFETMDANIGAATLTSTPNALRVGGSETAITLWAVDTEGAAVMAYDDEMAKAKPELNVPAEVPCDPVFGRNAEFNITWPQVSNATAYNLEIYTDAACTQRVWNVGTFIIDPTGATGVPANPLSPAWVIPANTLVAGKEYFTRLRCRDQAPNDIILSPWSSVHRFEVVGGERVQVSYLGVQPLGPTPGATDVPLSPGFTWSPYAGSTRYEFQLSKDAGMTDILAEGKISTTGYKYDGKLDYATTYFWRVRGIEPTISDWSPVASFTTEKAPPAPPAPPPAPPTPAPPVVTPAIIWAIIGIGAILVIAVIVLIVRTRRVA